MRHNLFIVALLLVAIGIAKCTTSSNNNIQIDDGYSIYKNGDTLFPDYVQDDTLIMVNAKLYNAAISTGQYQTDQDISTLLNNTCISLSNYRMPVPKYIIIQRNNRFEVLADEDKKLIGILDTLMYHEP